MEWQSWSDRFRTSRIGNVAAQSSAAHLLHLLYMRWLVNNKAKKNAESLSIQAVANLLGIKGGQVVDIAASDGWTNSSTVNYFSSHNWSGLAVEVEPMRFLKLAFNYKDFSRTSLFRGRVSPVSTPPLLRAAGIREDFEIFNLDIDSFDYFLFDALLTDGFRPRIASVEFNPNFPLDVFFAEHFHEGALWDGSEFYGCSLSAWLELLLPYGYELAQIADNNAIFAMNLDGRIGVETRQLTLSKFMTRGLNKSAQAGAGSPPQELDDEEGLRKRFSRILGDNPERFTLRQTRAGDPPK